jgi:hypothetical protein
MIVTVPKGVLRNDFKDRRFGIIRISEIFLKENSEIWKQIVKQGVVPFYVEYEFRSNTYKYTCYSEEFDIVSENIIIPNYEVIFTENLLENEKQFIIEFRKYYE